VRKNQTILFFKGASEARDKRTIELLAFIFPLTQPSPFGEGLCFLPVNTILNLERSVGREIIVQDIGFTVI